MKSNNRAPSHSRRPGHAGFFVGGAIALLLLGGIVLISKRLPAHLGDESAVSSPTTTGSAPKDPALTEPLKPPAYPAPAR